MNTEPEGKLEELLRDAGAEWRASQPSPELNFTPHQEGKVVRGRRWLVPVGAMASVLAVATVAASFVNLNREGVERTPVTASSGEAYPAEWILPADAGSGRRVRGAGTLLRSGDGRLMLCSFARTTLPQQNGETMCGGIGVQVAGAAAESFIASSGEAGGAASIIGVYRDGVVHLVSATADRTPAPTNPTAPEMPCRPPRDGWRPGYGIESAAAPDAINELRRWVESRSATYTDVWERQVDDAGQVKNIFVVGTTGDVKAAQIEIAAHYPGNLCMYQAKHSASDLQEIANQIREAFPARADVSADPVANRVAVTALVLDPVAISVLGRFGSDALTIRQPLLLPADK
ncbi:hypothetical protein ACLQ3H_03720 [Micromonospora saelicesensis]|uniref:hypothetical protein n=1 Tax=Micromonospora saelicesensis TaxID=285676 RepID=UPI003CED9AF2